MSAPTQAPIPQFPLESKKGSGLAITALVIAIVSLLLCWVPIVNNLVFFLGAIALILGIVAALRARKGRSGGRGLAFASVAISVLSLVGVLVTQAFYSSVLDEVGDSIEDAADGQVEKSDSDKEAEAGADVLALGETAQIGEYLVSIDKVQLHANDAIAKANEFNEGPKGQYVLVALTASYQGDEEGDPWIDLDTQLSGSDSRIYSTTTCTAVTPQPILDVPTLTHGGVGAGTVCFDVPAAALDEVKIAVGESFSLNDTRAYWSAS